MTQPLSTRPSTWDPSCIFHWSLVACVLLNFVVEGRGPAPVDRATPPARWLRRVLWGFIGTRHALFRTSSHPERVRRHVSGPCWPVPPRTTWAIIPLGR